MSFICILRLIGLLPEIHGLCSTKLTALAAARSPRRWSYDQKTAGLASNAGPAAVPQPARANAAVRS